MNNWKKEIVRDFLSLGSWIFFILVIGRILILPYRWPYLYGIVFAGVLIILLELIFKNKVDFYIARAVIIAFYTILFYENKTFTAFASLAFIGVLLSSFYLNRKFLRIIYGICIAFIVMGISYWMNGFI